MKPIFLFTDIEAILIQPSCRLLTILGPGGIGKTRIGLQIGALSNGKESAPIGL